MKDITSEYIVHIGEAYCQEYPGQIDFSSSTSYVWVVVPIQKGLYVDIRKVGINSRWNGGMIVYTDDNGNALQGDGFAIPNGSPDNQVDHVNYTRFRLRFPSGATMVYVNSAASTPPKVYKKIM